MNVLSFASKRLLSVTSLAVLLSSFSLAQQISASPQAPRPLITQPVDEARLTVLKGNTHALARPQFDLGTAPATLPMQRMLLVLKRSAEQESALRKLLDDQQDKHSPNYHKWLTPEQFGKEFGPTDADMQTITSWLQSHGFQVGTSKGRTVLEFSGSASQVKEAFHTTVHKYIVNGEQHWANASDPSIPTALTPAVAGVLTLHNFLKRPAIHVSEARLPAKFKPGSPPQFTSSVDGSHALTPEDYAVIYNGTQTALNGIDGTGTTIAVVARSDLFNNGQDVSDFRNVFGLPAGTINTVLDGADPGDLGGGDEAEATLDASWSGALATGATIDFVVSASTNSSDGTDLSELYIIENNLANVMTESFTSCEGSMTAADGQGISLLAEQAAAQGITYLLAAGDSGAAGCDTLTDTTEQFPISVSALAATPFTVAVGGTMFNENGQDATYWSTTNDASLGSALSYIPEDVWNETCTTACQPGQPPLAAGGGGASTFFPKPSWQFGVSGIPSDGHRDLPDVSLSAAGHDPYLLCLEGSCVPDSNGDIFFEGVEGTSASTPSFAGIIALVDDKMSQLPAPDNSPRQGQADYVLYPLAAAQQTSGTKCNASTAPLPNTACVFNDVTVGNNAVPGELNYGLPTAQYQAGVGYDLATGLGSVNVANLVSAWSSASFRPTTTSLTLNGATTPITVAHGSPVTVAITVTPSSGLTTPAPAGDVSLLAAIGPSGSTSNQTGVDMFTLSASGTFSGTTNQLPGGGPYSVTAHYAGDSTKTPTGVFAPSDSASPGIQVTVTAENSTTSLEGVFTLDQFGGWTVPVTAPQAFGTPILVSAFVQGVSSVGIPSGQITFTSKAGTIPNAATASLNSNGEASVQSNPFLVSGPIVPFDAGTFTISASYGGDASFNKSSSTTSVSFTIQPGFTGVSGLANVTVASPGASGTTTLGVVASTGFTTAISVTCTGSLPAGVACSASPITPSGPNKVVTGTITVTTTAATAALPPHNERPYYFAAMLFGALPLGSFLVVAAPRRRRWTTMLGLLALTFVIGLPACGGGSGSHTPPPQIVTPTPAGTYTINVSATAGSISQPEGSFTLTVK
jgi:hypothetical protein